MSHPYTYMVRRVIRVVDADTIDTELALGFGMAATMRLRLFGIDTPERFTSAGVDATAFTTGWLAARTEGLLVTTFKGAQSTVGVGDGAFGRWLGAFHHDGVYLADELHRAGYAKPPSQP